MLYQKEAEKHLVRRNGKFFHEIGAGTASAEILIDSKVVEIKKWINTEEFPEESKFNSEVNKKKLKKLMTS